MGNVAVYIRIYSMVTIHASSCARISHENVCIVLGFVKQKKFSLWFHQNIFSQLHGKVVRCFQDF